MITSTTVYDLVFALHANPAIVTDTVLESLMTVGQVTSIYCYTKIADVLDAISACSMSVTVEAALSRNVVVEGNSRNDSS